MPPVRVHLPPHRPPANGGLSTLPPVAAVILAIILAAVLVVLMPQRPVSTATRKRRWKADSIESRALNGEINPHAMYTNQCICQLMPGGTSGGKPGQWCRDQRARLRCTSIFLLPKHLPVLARKWMSVLGIPPKQQEVELNGGGKTVTNLRQKMLDKDTHRAVCAFHFHAGDIDYGVSGVKIALKESTAAGERGWVGRVDNGPPLPNVTISEIEGLSDRCHQDPVLIKAALLLPPPAPAPPATPARPPTRAVASENMVCVCTALTHHARTRVLSSALAV